MRMIQRGYFRQVRCAYLPYKVTRPTIALIPFRRAGKRTRQPSDDITLHAEPRTTSWPESVMRCAGRPGS